MLYGEPTRRLCLRVPESLMVAIEGLAEQAERNVSEQCVAMIAEAVK